MNAKSTQVPETVVESQSTQEAPADAGARSVKVRFDDRAMISNYANVANVGMSKDEVTVLFGTNQTWGTIGEEIVISLSSRIIMTPSVAKNLTETLQRVLQEYEKKLGKIS